MPTYHLPYGSSKLPLNLPETARVDWIEPAFIPAAPNQEQVVRDALAHPVDGQPLNALLAGKSVAIAVNDKTRPVPHDRIIPPLIDALLDAGVHADDITFYIAVGTHLPMSPDEFSRILPQSIINAYRIVSHDCDDQRNLVLLGETSAGTPIWANRRYFESDYKIVVGNIEPHHFAGFSGGYKTAAIGLAGRATITANHTMLAHPDARIAEITANPLRKDIDEIGAALGVQFALNVILNGDKDIIHAVSGSPTGVLRDGVPLSREACQIPNPGGRYDLVIASAGGAPKDINFYQAQKALSHASLFARDGGVVILVAECKEGTGSLSYEEFMQDVHTTAEVFQKFHQQGFRVGPHKAFQVAREAARLSIIMVSKIAPDKVAQLLITPASNLDSAYQIACGLLSHASDSEPRTVILPRATNTIPVS